MLILQLIFFPKWPLFPGSLSVSFPLVYSLEEFFSSSFDVENHSKLLGHAISVMGEVQCLWTKTGWLQTPSGVISNLTSNKTFCFCRFGNHLCFREYITRQKMQSTKAASVINQFPHAYKTYNEFISCSCWGFHVVIKMWHWLHIKSMMKLLFCMLENIWK